MIHTADKNTPYNVMLGIYFSIVLVKIGYQGLSYISAIIWGEPERAPHRRVERSQSIYYYYYYYYYYYVYMYGMSVTHAPL